ncbi:MAG: nickel/cobalt transporter [Alphaproteobacteria bacterium]|nr:nickel/cobalt transporter [Alphaproteobacteria bacterium]
MIGRGAGLLAIASVSVLMIVMCMMAIGQAAANPFGIGDVVPLRPVSTDGLSGWLLSKQAEFHRILVKALREARVDGNVQFGLIALSFTYGVFHAAGPGHGKAVITSYLLANEQAWRRGIALSIASALFQALVAILIVAIGSLLFDVTAKSMSATVRTIEATGFMMIAMVGAYLVWSKGRAFLRDLNVTLRPARLVAAGHPSGPDHIFQNPSQFPKSGNDSCLCGHAHGFDATALAQTKSWRAGFVAALAVGLRPCTGAIVVLVFAWSQDIMLVGIASTLLMAVGTAMTVATIATVAVKAKSVAVRFLMKREGFGVLAFRGVEVCAAALVLALGLLLLTGYVTGEAAIAGR